MDDTKILISLRIPSTLLEKVDEEAVNTRRSRAFIISDILAANYAAAAANGKRKPVKKVSKQ